MFVFFAPSADNAKVTIIPDDISTYAPLDTSMRVAKMKVTTGNRKFVVKQVMHRVQFRVRGYA